MLNKCHSSAAASKEVAREVLPASPSYPITTIVTDNLLKKNIISFHLLMLCPMLAVSVSVKSAVLLSLLTLMVMTVAGVVIAWLRQYILEMVRIPIFLIIVATLVALVDITVEAFLYDKHQQLGIFLPLIITNCGVLARLEVFASKQSPKAAAIDGCFTGIGMLLALTLLAFLREFIGTGKIEGLISTPLFTGIPLAILPAGGFFLFAFILAGLQFYRNSMMQPKSSV